jgi:LAS superfamily LD-carboxypeptidase LdcB
MKFVWHNETVIMERKPKSQKVNKKKRAVGKQEPTSKHRAVKYAIIGIVSLLTAAALSYFSYSFYQNHINTQNTYPRLDPAVFDIGTMDAGSLSSLLGQSIPYSSEAGDYTDIYEQIDESKAENIPTVSGQTPEATSGSNDWAAYPETILPCTRDGDDLLVLVNKQFQLPSTYEPSDLVALTTTGLRATNSSLLIRNIIASDLAGLVTAAKAENIDLAALSAYRSYATQQTTYNYWVAYNGGDTAAADMISARPGHSQHQLGTTVDFTTNEISDQLGQHFAGTAAGTWLASHAWEYGFALAYPSGWEAVTGYSYEPWHFRYIGKDNAAEWQGSGKILELWLRDKN